MNLNTGWTELNSAMKTLSDRWEETKVHWSDPVAQHFEESIWGPLENQVRATLRGIERLTPALIKLQRDCGPCRDSGESY